MCGVNSWCASLRRLFPNANSSSWHTLEVCQKRILLSFSVSLPYLCHSPVFPCPGSSSSFQPSVSQSLRSDIASEYLVSNGKRCPCPHNHVRWSWTIGARYCKVFRGEQEGPMWIIKALRSFAGARKTTQSRSKRRTMHFFRSSKSTEDRSRAQSAEMQLREPKPCHYGGIRDFH
jgi:hypothetical protein